MLLEIWVAIRGVAIRLVELGLSRLFEGAHVVLKCARKHENDIDITLSPDVRVVGVRTLHVTVERLEVVRRILVLQNALDRCVRRFRSGHRALV